MLLFACLIGGVVFGGALRAQERLIEQRSRGTTRDCIYALARSTLSRNRFVTRTVGAGEPCPGFYSEPAVEQPQVPLLAVLKSQKRQGGKLICEYAFGGRSYRKPASGYGICPYTPSVF